MGIISTLCAQNNITINALDRDITAFAFPGKTSFRAVINGNAGLWEQRLSAAHELAHVIFGHLEPRNSNLSDEVRESEARIFSCTLTAIIAYFEAIAESSTTESATKQ